MRVFFKEIVSFLVVYPPLAEMADDDKSSGWKPGQRKKKSEKVDSTWNPKSKKIYSYGSDYRVSYSRSHRLFLEATSSQKVFSLDQIGLILALPTMVYLRDT